MHKQDQDFDRINNAFEQLNPTDEQSEKMWERLKKANEHKNHATESDEKEIILKKKENVSGKGSSKSFKLPGYIAAAVLAVVVIGFVGVGFSATAGKNILSKMGISNKKPMVTEINESEIREDILDNASLDAVGMTLLYAPDLQYIDDEILIFGNLRGLIIYDRQSGQVRNTIDTQAIGCNFMNADTKQTCVLKEKGNIYLFNSKDNIPYGDLYRVSCEEEGASPEKVEADIALLTEKYDIWKDQYKNKKDTFDYFCEMAETKHVFEEYGNGVLTYSCNSKEWLSGEGGTKTDSFLVVKEDQYYLYSYAENTKELTMEVINILQNHVSDPEKNKLPEYVYHGDNAAIAAIYDYMKQNVYSDSDTEIIIPEYVILKEDDKNGEHLVFGNFYDSYYIKVGNTLHCNGGGEYPACFHLKSTENGYEVVSVDAAGEGAFYVKSIKAFTKGYPGLYDKFMDHEKISMEYTLTRKQVLAEYITDNDLDILYYKDYGWDPVAIFE